MTKLSRLEPEQQTEAAKRLAEGTIRSVDEYTAGDAVTREKDYYCTGAFIVDAFSEHNHTLGRIPEFHRLCLDKYREKLSSAQIKKLICKKRPVLLADQSEPFDHPRGTGRIFEYLRPVLQNADTVCDNGGGGSKRQEVKTLLRRLKRDSPNIEKSIFNAIHAVTLDTFPGWKTGGEVHSFLESYAK